jgi:ATP/maltotriose-dependent transcriptional regulator MalT
MLARTRALLAEDEEAEALYLEAIDHLKHCRVTPQLARARLLYGEWLRRERQRDAREELREAARMFASMGAEAFARRAEDELSATGEHLITRGPETFDVLTAQETQIAELASDGESNREIASRLYVSPRTIEYHLRKIFKKVGVSGRMELAQQLRAGSVDRGEDAAKELSLDGDEPGSPVEAPSGSVVGLDDDQ